MLPAGLDWNSYDGPLHGVFVRYTLYARGILKERYDTDDDQNVTCGQALYTLAGTCCTCRAPNMRLLLRSCCPRPTNDLNILNRFTHN
uniref:Uncharacterized protein n=1 Tax=Romanomermis culicivorax TaxID=13658 RepID=A0A915IKQ2_ROMCU